MDHERGWSTWIHTVTEWVPSIPVGWKKKVQPVTIDRCVTVAYDPKRFTEKISDEHEMIEVFRNDTYKVVLFAVGS